MNVAEGVGWAVTAVAVAGVLLNNRRDRRCFYLWIVSNSASAVLHILVRMYALSVRDLIFLALSVAGLFAWSVKRGR